MPIDALRSLGRSNSWHVAAEVPVGGDVGHPQGLCRWGHGWLVSTVFPGRAAGELMVVAADGEVQRRSDITDAERFHPGGLAVVSPAPGELPGSAGCWVAVAEYRPRSTSTVLRLDAVLAVADSFGFDDHLGAICPLGDGTLFAVSWASRRWYRLDQAGHILEQRTTPTRWVDLQDIGCADGSLVAASGVGSLATPSGELQLGGLVLIDVDAMAVVHDTPVAAWMPSGRAATYNGAHLDVATEPDGAATSATEQPVAGQSTSAAHPPLRLHCLVDDTTATITTWAAEPQRTGTG